MATGRAAAADGRVPVDDVGCEPGRTAREEASARAPTASAGTSSSRPRAPARAACGVRLQRRFERRVGQLVDAQRPHQRVAAQRSDQSARPAMMPACGPPSSLSPLKHTRSAPAASVAGPTGSSASAGSAGRAGRCRGPRRAAACSWAAAATVQRGALGEALDAEVRRMHAKDQRRAGRRSRRRSRAAACGWSCRPRTRIAPDCAMTSARGSRRRSRPARRARR